MTLETVFEKNKNWIVERLSTDPDYFYTLGKGQSPEPDSGILNPLLRNRRDVYRIRREELIAIEEEQKICPPR